MTKTLGFRIPDELHAKYLLLDSHEKKVIQVDLNRFLARKVKNLE